MANFLDDYEPVEDRLRKFWHDHPGGRVFTEIIAGADGDYIVKAALYRGDELRDSVPAATGLAHDSADQLPANMKASALEVCETSAIGRALANMNYAAKGKRPSREEMAKASPAAATSYSRTRAAVGDDVEAVTAVSGAQLAVSAGNAGGGVAVEGKAAAPPSIKPSECTHPADAMSPLAPSGRALKEGRMRCVLCGTVLDVAA